MAADPGIAEEVAHLLPEEMEEDAAMASSFVVSTLPDLSSLRLSLNHHPSLSKPNLKNLPNPSLLYRKKRLLWWWKRKELPQRWRLAVLGVQRE